MRGPTPIVFGRPSPYTNHPSSAAAAAAHSTAMHCSTISGHYCDKSTFYSLSGSSGYFSLANIAPRGELPYHKDDHAKDLGRFIQWIYEERQTKRLDIRSHCSSVAFLLKYIKYIIL